MSWVFCGIICILLIEQCMENLYKHTSSYKEMLGNTEDIRKGVPYGLEIVNIGSGPGLYAISYKHSDKLGFNFSTTPQSYKYGFRLLKRFKDHIKNDAIIIIIIMCPLSFAWVCGTNDPSYSYKFYGILSKEDIDHYTYGRGVALKIFPLLLKLVSKIKTFIDRKNIYEINKQDLPIVSCWKEECRLQNLKDPMQAKEHEKVFAEKVEIVKNGIGFCFENNWRPIFVIPPIPMITKEYISHEFVDVFVYQNLKKILLKYPDIPVLDYFFDNRFTEDMFQDDIFMNETGQTVFSEILFKDIKEVSKENKCARANEIYQ